MLEAHNSHKAGDAPKAAYEVGLIFDRHRCYGIQTEGSTQHLMGDYAETTKGALSCLQRRVSNTNKSKDRYISLTFDSNVFTFQEWIPNGK